MWHRKILAEHGKYDNDNYLCDDDDSHNNDDSKCRWITYKT